MIGRKISHYFVTEKIGQGGMGIVYKARDTHLDRNVAIKVLPPEAVANLDRKRRFVQEAKAASALNHPNIITIYDISQSEGVDFIAMEYVEGQTLDRLIRSSGLSCEQTVDYAVQIGSALAAAHAAGIVHRDLKPSNIMVTEKGLVKVLDFGLAKLTESVEGGEASRTQTMSSLTEQGAIVGTVAYMSPEQAEGKPVDARSEVFSFGSVLYEMVTGRRAFQGESTSSTLSAILRDTPKPVRKLRADVPAALERIIDVCLKKDRDARYASGTEVWKELTAVQSQLATRRVGFRQMLRKPQFAIPMLALLVAVAVMIGWYGIHSSRVRWASTIALQEIDRLIGKHQRVAALRLLRMAESYASQSPALMRLKEDLFTSPVSIGTKPPGADIYAWDYADAENKDSSKWELLGRSPLVTDHLPRGLFRIRTVKEGFEPVERAVSITGAGRIELQLHSSATTPVGMVWISGIGRGSTATFPVVSTAEVASFWLDKYEVTNRKFKEFVDAGGYQKQQYWKQLFNKDGRVLSWAEAMTLFHDATGRPGPATWELGIYPEGKAEFPVGGLSWYEAAAYAEFAGKSLPTVYHWLLAANVGGFSEILNFSNFSGKGPAPVGSHRGMSTFGNYDMAGNLKEWCWNAVGDRRYVIGGGWNEPSYMFSLPEDARFPFDRAPAFGFRCAKYTAPIPDVLAGPVPFISRDRRNDKPATDQAYQIYRSLHSYDKTDLKPSVESVDEAQYWRREKVTFQAAYGNERVLAYLYLPKSSAPPHQVLTYFPGADALTIGTIDGYSTGAFEFIVRSGRALMLPVYKGTLERGPSTYYHQLGQPNLWREMNLQWSKDLGRSIDYLETRPEIDARKLAFYGVSLGAAMGPHLIAMEPRFVTGLLVMGGSFEKVPPEVDSWNFAPRVRIPILMANGKDDFRFPLETSQRPLFHLLGTPEKDKRLALYQGGHNIVTQVDLIKDVLEWLDRYLGPVRTR